MLSEFINLGKFFFTKFDFCGKIMTLNLIEGVSGMDNSEILSFNMEKTDISFYSITKRLFDILVSLVGILFLLPIMLVVKIMNIASKDYNPIFYCQERIGKNGKLFKFYKFRSMVPNADEILFKLLETDKKAAAEYKKNKKLKHDPRITKAGKILRKTSLDELPQLINVLKGDMSLIGNRPYLPREKEDMEGFYEEIIKTKPGITGYWQVSGRSDTTFRKRLELETYYSNNYSWKLDIKIFFKTFSVVLFKKGAK